MSNPAAAPAYPAPRYAWYVVALLAAAFALSYVDRQILSLLVEPIKRDLSLSDTQISLLHGFTFAIFYSLLGLPLGRLADHSNRRRLIVYGIAGWSVMTALCGLSRNFWHLFLARVGVAVGEASLSPAAFSLIADYFPPAKRARAISLYTLGPFMGGGIAFLVGGAITATTSQASLHQVPLLGALAGWQVAFLIVGLPGLLLALLLLTIREPARQGLATGVAVHRIRDTLRYVLGYRRAYLTQGFGFALLAMITLGSFAWVPSFFVRTYGWPVSRAAFAFGTVVLVLGSLGTLLSGVVADKLMARGKLDAYQRLGMVVAFGIALPAVLAPLMPTPQAALVCFGISMVFQGCPVALGPAAFNLITPNQMRGQVIALYYFLISLLGLGVGPTAIALITDQVFGDPAALRYSLAIFAGAVAPLAFLLIASGRAAYRSRVHDLWPELRK